METEPLVGVAPTGEAVHDYGGHRMLPHEQANSNYQALARNRGLPLGRLPLAPLGSQLSSSSSDEEMIDIASQVGDQSRASGDGITSSRLQGQWHVLFFSPERRPIFLKVFPDQRESYK